MKSNITTPEKTTEDTVVFATTFILSTGVGMVVRNMLKASRTLNIESQSPMTKAFLVIGELAIAGVISDSVTKKYEKMIRSTFKKYATQPTPEPEGKDEAQVEKEE